MQGLVHKSAEVLYHQDGPASVPAGFRGRLAHYGFGIFDTCRVYCLCDSKPAFAVDSIAVWPNLERDVKTKQGFSVARFGLGVL